MRAETFQATSLINLSTALHCASRLGHSYTLSQMTDADSSFPDRICFQKDWQVPICSFSGEKNNIFIYITEGHALGVFRALKAPET